MAAITNQGLAALKASRRCRHSISNKKSPEGAVAKSSERRASDGDKRKPNYFFTAARKIRWIKGCEEARPHSPIEYRITYCRGAHGDLRGILAANRNW